MIDEVENVPLLAEQEEHGDDNAANDDPIASYAPRSKLSKFGSKLRDHLSRWSVIYLCGIFIFIIELPVYMRVAPSLRLIEQGVCRDYYKVVDPSVIAPNGDVDEGLCKLSEIQQNFARFRGLLGALSPIPGECEMGMRVCFYVNRKCQACFLLFRMALWQTGWGDGS